MAKYRQVYITYWQDPFIEELEPLEKYFYLYLITNSKTTQCGCYEISMKLMKYETGLSKEQIESFINLFQAENKIHYNYDTNEFLIMNWLRHNSFKSPKVKSCIDNEMKTIKSKEFKHYIDCIVNKNIPIGRLLIDYTKTMDTSSQQEQEEEQEENNNNIEPKEDFKELLLLYQKNVEEFPTKAVLDGLTSWYNHFGYEIVKESIMITAKANVRKYNYMDKILKNWLNDGVKTLDDVQELDQKRNNKQLNGANIDFMAVARRVKEGKAND